MSICPWGSHCPSWPQCLALGSGQHPGRGLRQVEWWWEWVEEKGDQAIGSGRKGLIWTLSHLEAKKKLKGYG